MKKLLSLLAASFLLAGTALAEERATPQDAEELVKTGIAYFKKHGAEKAFKEFQNKNGPFVYKDLYLALYDTSGKCVAHGADPARVGKSFLDAKDPDGKPFIKERIDVVKASGKGWQDYKFKNPATGKVEQKTSYFELSGDVIFTAGAYK
jgi:cytochrome c